MPYPPANADFSFADFGQAGEKEASLLNRLQDVIEQIKERCSLQHHTEFRCETKK